MTMGGSPSIEKRGGKGVSLARIIHEFPLS
jgi:hypothetical protein